MGISKQKRVPHSDVTADLPSGDSLSFAGLLSVQEQYAMALKTPVSSSAHAKKPAQVYKQDLEFEFSVTTQCSVTGSPTRIASADVVFSKGQFQTKATASHLDQLPTSQSNDHRSNRSNASEANLEKHMTGPDNGTTEETNKTVSGSKPWFQSFITPCRNCRAEEPSRQVLHQGKPKNHQDRFSDKGKYSDSGPHSCSLSEL